MRQRLIEISVPANLSIGETVSVTAFRRFWRCPLSYWFAHIAGLGEPVSAGDRSFGSHVHRTLARYFSSPPYSPTIHAFRRAAFDTWRHDDEQADPETPYRVAARAQKVLNLIDISSWEIVASERRVEHRFGQFNLEGRADLLYRDSSGHRVVADFKSYCGRSQNMLGVDVSFNFNSLDPFFSLRCYDTLIALEIGDLGAPTVLELLFLEDSTFARVDLDVNVRELHYAELARRFEAMANFVDARVWVARTGPHCRRCTFLSWCPAARGTTGPVVLPTTTEGQSIEPPP